MITISSYMDCDCIDGELRYIKINYKKGNGELVLECTFCKQLFDLKGNKIQRKIYEYVPATIEDIKMYSNL